MNQDLYHLWIPIQDDEDSLLKSVEVDANGDYIVQGVMTSDAKDEENDRIAPEGMDCSYFLTKGWIKYEHGNRPEQFIGEPLEVRVGQFTHPKLQKSVNGIFVKGRLFAHRALTKQAVQTIQDLQKSNTNRCMGWSIEGQVTERDRKTGKIAKSVLRNVVLTMNPINTTTWVELAKSFANNHEVTVECEEPLDKAMDTGSIAEVTPQSLEGAPKKKEDDPQKKYIELLQQLIKEHFTQKSLRAQFLQSNPAQIKATTFYYAVNHDFSIKEAEDFSTYIAERDTLFKSLFRTSFGGETMESLASFLDQELEELKKSLELDADEEEALEKSAGKADEDEDDSAGAEDEDSDNDEDDEDTKKSFNSKLTKSLAEDHGQAFEVSDFLSSMTDELGYSMEGLEKSMSHMMKQSNALVKSMSALMQFNQELAQKVEALEAQNEDLRKSLGDVLQRPVGRKSVVNPRERHTLSKSGSGEVLTPAKAMDILEKSFEAGEINGSEVIRFEAGVPLHNLNLPETVKAKLGI